jgi:muramoyltetrapeptide carboxypeptidase
MGVAPRTAAGWIKVRPVRPGATIALVAPASAFPRVEFDKGVAELRRLGFDAVWDDRIFESDGFVAGLPAVRAESLNDALRNPRVDAIMSVRGGYGSVQILPLVDLAEWQRRRTAFVGYSDVTSIHTVINQAAGLVSIHGPMLEGRISRGPEAYDPTSFLTALLDHPVGEITSPNAAVLSPGADVAGPILGGTLTQLVASLGTPYAFDPPAGHILFLDEVGERPYRLDRMLTQLKFAGILARAAAVVFNELPRCDEPGGAVTARDTVRNALAGFPGPVLFGVPSGHASGESVTLPFGVRTRVVTSGAPRLIVEEAAAGD